GLASSSEGKRTILKTLRHPKESCNDYGFLLSTLGQLWASGIPVDWKALHQDEPCSRVQLPTYPFERQRYWIESGQRSADQSGGPLARNPNQPEWFYLPSWTRTAGRPVRSPAPSDQTDIADKVTQVGDCLVFCDALGIGDRIAALIRSEGGKATTVHSGGPFNQINAESYSIDPANREDYQQLLEATLSSGVIPKTILHLWNVTADSTGGALSDTYKDGLTYAFSSLVFLAQAIGEHASDKKIKLMVVSNGLYDVIGTEALVPIKALTRGPCKVIPLEYSNVSCISVDVSTPDLSEQSVSDLACCLILETASGRHDSTVAYRSRHRWVQGFEHVIFEGRRAPEPIFKPGGVYLFTGGLSEVEFALARQSAETSPTRLAFIGLPELPPRSEWASFVAGEGQTPAGNAIAMIRELESLDAAVLPVQAEISNRESMSAALQRIRMEFGPINGVIHSAFKPGGGMVQLKTLASAEEVFAPKVLGTIMLHELLQDDPLDFFVIFASSFSILGAFGQVDYCAANAFVDAFAAWQASQSGPPAVAIDWHITGWEIWQETAMAAAPHIQAQLQKVRTDYGVTAQEAVSCVSEVIPRGIPQIVVSTQDFLRVLKEQDPATSNLLEQFGSLNFAAASQERAGTGSYVEPAGEIEQAIAAIWQDVFGITQIGAKDDFFDTGGNSLMAIQVISKLRKNFHVGLPLSSLFEHPTVEGLAAEIQAAGARAEEMAQIESLLAEIEDLSPEQVASALAAEEPS
ncbi:MAG TPA: KR domain-containing protein, partial [Blastocatellia bacterium]